MSTWKAVSQEIADAVASVAPSIVQVHGRRRVAAGIVFEENLVVTTAPVDEGTVAVRAGNGDTREGAALGEVCDLAGDCASSEEGPVLCYGGRCLLQLEGEPGDGPCYIQGSENRPLVAYTCPAKNGVYCHRGTKTCEAQVGADEPCPYAVIIDRISHEVPYYRSHLKNAVV